MSDLKHKFENTKDKVIGKTNEGIGKATGNEEMELKGKLQYQKAELKQKVNNIKDKLAEKINDKLDEK